MKHQSIYKFNNFVHFGIDVFRTKFVHFQLIPESYIIHSDCIVHWIAFLFQLLNNSGPVIQPWLVSPLLKLISPQRYWYSGGKAGVVLLGILGGSMLPSSPNPNSTSNHVIFHSRFQTWPLCNHYLDQDTNKDVSQNSSQIHICLWQKKFIPSSSLNWLESILIFRPKWCKKIPFGMAHTSQAYIGPPFPCTGKNDQPKVTF